MPTRTYSGHLKHLAAICDFVTEQAALAGLDEAQTYAVQLAVDEAATNIVEHAYGGEGRGSFSITCKVTAEGLKVVLKDGGAPFDPSSVPEPVTGVPLEELKSRGLGVFLIRQMMDEVTYQFGPDGNKLTLFKRK
ncbi:MAG TPA: ATP-binding protein [Anaerolineales bacterium]|nr:ATP-binding protein [Anaerolineales bacterium]